MAKLNTQSSVQEVEGANTPSTNENVTENITDANQGSDKKLAKYEFTGSYTFHYAGKEYRKGDILEIESKVFTKSFVPFAEDWKKL